MFVCGVSVYVLFMCVYFCFDEFDDLNDVVFVSVCLNDENVLFCCFVFLCFCV